MMHYEHENLNEFEKNIMGYIYAFSALGFVPIEIEIYNARVVMGTKKKKSDGEYMYKFNEMDLDKPDYTKFQNQIIDEANDFYVQLVERGTDQKDLDSFKSILFDLENNRDSIWDMGNILVQYMNENAPVWLRDRFYKHKYKVSDSLNMLLRDASFTDFRTKTDPELDSVIRNLNQVYHEEQMTQIDEQEINRKRTMGVQPRIRPRSLLHQMAKTFALTTAIMGF